MATHILVENGNWRPLNDVAGLKGIRKQNIRKAIDQANRHCKNNLGLRQPPIEIKQDQFGEYVVRARGVSGTFSSNNFSINIAPKFAPQANIEENWCSDLLSLVRYSKKRDHLFTQSFNLKTSDLQLIDLLAMAFLDAVEIGMRDQLIHTYRREEYQLPIIRGRLNIHRQVKSIFKTPHLFQCDVDYLDAQNNYNNLIKWAASVFSQNVKSPQLQRRIIESSYKIPGLPNDYLAKRKAKITPPPQYRSWEAALEICAMLHSSISLNSGNGSKHGYSMLFNMEKLFEQCVERLLKRSVKSMKQADLKCKPQASIRYAKPIAISQRSFHSKPDNLIYGNNGSVALVDAKYKRLSDKEGQKNRKPQNPDVYELIAGMTAHQCSVGLLVYPKVYSDTSLNDDALKIWEVNSFGQKLKIGSLAIDLSMLKDKAGTDKLSSKVGKALDRLIDT